MKKNLFYFIFILVVISCKDSSIQNTDNNFKNFLWMWELDKIEVFNEDTGIWQTDSNYFGWVGHILYDGQGHMGVQIVPNGYKNFDTKKNLDDLSKEELKELVKFYKSNWVYFANYSIKSDTIEHHRITATEPSDWGTTVIRGFEFNGDILYLIPRDALTNKKTRLC